MGEIDYCVTCHNPGSTDANSGNSVDFGEMIHRIHRGADLPSVRAGNPYVIYGFANVLHDYSDVVHPQDVRYCTSCHSGSASDDGRSVPTPQGDNWSEFPTRRACGACHDDIDFAVHFGGQDDDTHCRSCHAMGGAAGSVAASHVIPVDVAARRFAFDLVAVNDTAPGQRATLDFRVVDPLDGNRPYDLASAPAFQQSGARLGMTVAWPNADYTNTRPGATDASSIATDVLTSAIALGDGMYRVTASLALPDGSSAPFVAATGSGTVALEGRAALDVDPDSPGAERIPIAVRYFSIDEPDDRAVARRQVVDFELCQACHERLVLHGDNRSDTVQGCVTCHNARNTDRSVRLLAVDPPDDGKAEESLDFKTMIHAIHASGFREAPLQIVGFLGRSTHVYDNARVRYPNRLSDCSACHVDGTFALPLAATVLGTSVDTGGDRADPADDTVVSPVTAVCASCHDGAAARSHMRTNGGDFATTQAMLDSGVTLEHCVTCHGPGAVSDTATVHTVAR